MSCPDTTGIVAKISGFLADIGGWITQASYHSDPGAGRFYTRQEIRADSLSFGLDVLRDRFGQIAAALSADHVRVSDSTVRKKVALLVSTQGHCLYDLLSRWHSGELGADVSVVIGNHDALAPVAALFGVRFEHVPIPADPNGKQAAFEDIAAIVDSGDPDAIVLARFMQVVPPQWCTAWDGRLINIHHGFLPSFRGARPYQQAYDRGVKLVGATCHYVTADLDAGPIIAQDVISVDHTDSPAEMARRGREVERAVLARGLSQHLQDRVLLDGRRTVVFG